MKYLSILLLCSVLFASCGETIQGNGNVTSENREVSGFHSVEISGFFQVELVEGKEGVEISTDENLHEHIQTEVKNGSLRIYTDNKNLDAEELIVTIHFKNLNSVSIAGAASVDCKSTIEGERFDFDVSGAADAQLDVKVKHLSLDLAGGSDVEVKGKAEMADIDIAGAGDVKALKLKTKQCKVSISGAGEVEIDVDNSLDVNITGAGEVRYKGNPDDVKKSITGAGELTQL